MAVCAGITISGTTITVSYDPADGTHGASFDNPYTFEDIYDTDQANGWGLLKRHEDNLYYIDGGITITTSLTFFQDQRGVIKFKNSIGGHVYFLYNNDANLDIQYYEFIKDMTGGIGSIKLRTYTIGVDCQIKNSTFKDLHSCSHDGGVIIDKCTYYNLGGSFGASKTLNGLKPEFSNISLYNTHFEARTSPAKAENIRIYKDYCFYFLPYENETIILRNIKTYENSKKGHVFGWKPNALLICIDCELTYEWRWVTFGSYDSGDLTIEEKTTFNANIINSTGGILTIEDKDGNVVFTETLGSEKMTEQEITYHKEYRAHENSVYLTDTQITEYHPFTLRVTKPGYQDLEIPGITVTPGQPTTIYGEMVEPTYVDRRLVGTIDTPKLTGSIDTINLSGTIKTVST